MRRRAHYARAIKRGSAPSRRHNRARVLRVISRLVPYPRRQVRREHTRTFYALGSLAKKRAEVAPSTRLRAGTKITMMTERSNNSVDGTVRATRNA